ncbi:MAG TPA: class I SAM-dependent methyltransferase [Blastocatellia bacterium]|nr:class I SAM-dependent methyltransferase [Blastocatellia bacterium]
MQRIADVAATQKPGAETAALEVKIAALADGLLDGQAFELQLSGGAPRRIGTGEVAFRLAAHNERGMAALSSLDERRIGEAYLDGDLDLDGDLVAALNLRVKLTDRHPLTYLWSTYGQRLLFGQVNRDKKWIGEHYDHDSEFYLLFLDRQSRCYSHGYFEHEDETLEAAIERKLTTAMEACRMRPGWRVLDIGAGWGAFTEHAGARGVQVTSLTISRESERYVRDLIERKKLPCRVIREHFLEYRSDEPYDAIVNLGVTEHLPDYAATLAQYQRLLKPGGRVFLDACAARTKFPFSSFTLSHIWPGNATPLALADYLNEVARTPFELLSVHNDRRSYMLTTRHWAENLDRRRDEVVARWGERLYRQFRLYLWGCVHSFSMDDVTAYRLLLELPAAGRRSLDGRSRFFKRLKN